MDAMKIANSIPMWIACGIPVILVIAQALIFAKKSYSAGKLQATVDPAIKDRDQRMYEAKEKALADGVVSRNAWEKAPLTASSDSGDVSQMMPMNLFTAVCWPVGVAPHTWQSCASAGRTIGQKGAFYAAKVIAATAYDLYTQPELRKEIQDEFDAQDREPYAPMYEGE